MSPKWKRLFVAASLVLLATVAGLHRAKAAEKEPLRFQPACFDHAQKDYAVTLFPLAEKQPTIDVAVPTPSATANLVSFDYDGRSLYVQEPVLLGKLPHALFKIELAPTRMTEVAATEGLGNIWSITMSNSSPRKMFVSAVGSEGSCGAYEIDPQSGARRVLRLGGPN